MITQKRPWQVYLILVGLNQCPNMLYLIAHGHLIQVLGATLLGATLGWTCRPVIQRKFIWLLPVVLGAGLAASMADDTMWRLIYQVLVAFMVVSAWPQDPKRRNRRRLQAVVDRVRRWSTGMPRVASLKVLMHRPGRSTCGITQ